MRCPTCKKGCLRVQVDLFLDVPAELMHGLSKAALRRREVRVMGANWPKARTYCDNPDGCPSNASLLKGR